MATDIYNNILSVEKNITLHELETSTTFRLLKSEKNFGKENIDLSDNTFTIRYEDTQKNAVPPIQYDGVPFLIRGKRTLECHQGKDRSKKKKERAQLLRNQETDHDYRKKRKHLQTTKKKDCPAMIKIRHLVKFTDFKLEDNTPYGRDRMSAQIHDAVDKKNNLNIEHVYLIFLPDVSSHQNHFTGEYLSDWFEYLDDGLGNLDDWLGYLDD